MTNQLAASAVFVCLYVGAVDGENKVRPSMVLWMCDEAARRTGPQERQAWYRAALRGKRELAGLLGGWGVVHRPWYADNTREPLRDETFRAWLQFGGMLRDESIPTSSAKPQWSLTREFAELFDPDLAGDALAERVEDWRDDHLGTIGRARIAVAQRLASQTTDVAVRMPDGSRRTLAAGGSSLILQGVIEELAPRLLRQPAVLFVSESRQHIDVVDAQLLGELGIAIDRARLLPDALLLDAAGGALWFVEAVYTDGPIDEQRRAALTRWAREQGIPEERCRFLTAFAGRTAAPFRRLAPSLAWGTDVWFLDEPDKLIRLERL